MHALMLPSRAQRQEWGMLRSKVFQKFDKIVEIMGTRSFNTWNNFNTSTPDGPATTSNAFSTSTSSIALLLWLVFSSSAICRFSSVGGRWVVGNPCPVDRPEDHLAVCARAEDIPFLQIPEESRFQRKHKVNTPRVKSNLCDEQNYCMLKSLNCVAKRMFSLLTLFYIISTNLLESYTIKKDMFESYMAERYSSGRRRYWRRTH